MKQTVVTLVFSAFLLPSAGCILHTHHRPGHHHSSVRSKGKGRHHHHHKKKRRCHPSQRWDGERCRHKGKGHGARKHDD